MNVITLRRPEALGIPDIQDLLRRALDSTHMVAPNGLDTVAQDVTEVVEGGGRIRTNGHRGGVEADRSFEIVLLRQSMG